MNPGHPDYLVQGFKVKPIKNLGKLVAGKTAEWIRTFAGQALSLELESPAP